MGALTSRQSGKAGWLDSTAAGPSTFRRQRQGFCRGAKRRGRMEDSDRQSPASEARRTGRRGREERPVVWHRARREGSSPCWVATGGQRRASRAGVRRGKRRGKRSGEERRKRKQARRWCVTEKGRGRGRTANRGGSWRPGRATVRASSRRTGGGDGRRAAPGEHRHLLPRTLTQAAREGSAKDEPEHVVVLWCCGGDTATRLPLDGRRERARATSVTATEAVVLEGGGWSGVAGVGSG